MKGAYNESTLINSLGPCVVTIAPWACDDYLVFYEQIYYLLCKLVTEHVRQFKCHFHDYSRKSVV